jgi:hypothetical protein
VFTTKRGGDGAGGRKRDAITADGFYQLFDMNNTYPPLAGSNQ